MTFGQQDNVTDELVEQHEINVTPFIDVILVLLIIFMVAAPLATVSVPVNLPSSTASNEMSAGEPLYLTLQHDLTLTLGEKQTVLHQQLISTLQDQQIDKQQQIFLRADELVSYGELIKLMNLLAQAGYHKIALVGLDTPDNNPLSR